MKNLENNNTYQAVSLFRNDIAVIVSAKNEDLEARIESSQVHLWYDEQWSTIDLTMSCIATATWTTELMKATYMSYDGMILIDDGENEFQGEIIDNSDNGPSNLVQMKTIKCIDDSLIAVGMARLAYKKTLPDGEWQKIDKGLFVPREERTTAVGLTDVVSDGNGGLLAVGYKSEIWHMTSEGSWQQENSPSQVYLSSIAKHPNKEEFTIVGLHGVIIKGSPKLGWSLQETVIKQDFWSVAYFMDKIFIASDLGLFIIEKEGLKAIDFNTEETVTTRFLDTCTDAIWSVGDNHIFSSQDGIEWTKVLNP